jgi:hypothetical protein
LQQSFAAASINAFGICHAEMSKMWLPRQSGLACDLVESGIWTSLFDVVVRILLWVRAPSQDPELSIGGACCRKLQLFTIRVRRYLEAFERQKGPQRVFEAGPIPHGARKEPY